MMRIGKRVVSAVIFILLAACHGDPDAGGEGEYSDIDAEVDENDSDIGADTEPDTEHNPDTDSDSDIESDSDIDRYPDPVGDQMLSERYPGDEGMGEDPAVIWYENFEQASIEELADRYDSTRTNGMTFSAETPESSAGVQSVAMAAGGDFGAATDLYTQLPEGHDHLYIRYYARHQEGSNYHHTRAGLGGHNPPSPWPTGGAGNKPEGDDRFSVTVEPMGNGPERRLDFYNYWMNMHSWEEGNPEDGSAYGNTLAHRDDFRVADGEWFCLEVMARLNQDPDSAEGGELATWLNGELVRHYDAEGPMGYWIRDKFCPADADTSACLDYAPAEDEREQEVLDLQWRTSLDLNFSYLWIQNYISSESGSVEYDDLVVATERIGCLVE